MKTKTFTLFSKLALTLSLMLCISVPSWSATTYKLIDHEGEVLTGDFRCERDVNGGDAKTFGTKSFNHYVTTGYSKTAITNNKSNDFVRMFAYDVRSTNTTIRAYVYGNGAATFYISELKEGMQAEEAATTSKHTNSIANQEAAIIERTLTNTSNSTVFFYASPNNNARIYQIEIEETGEPLLTGGDPGYEISFDKGRGIFNSNVTNMKYIDGIEVKPKDNVRPFDQSYLNLSAAGVDYIGFNVTVPCSLRVYFNSGKTGNRYYNLSQTKADPSPAPERTFVVGSPVVSPRTIELPNRGKWYFNRGTGGDIYISKIEFVPINYTISFSSTKGTVPATIPAGARAILNAITDGGAVQEGWTADKDVVVDNEVVDAGTQIDCGKAAFVMENTTFTAVWGASASTVKFMDGETVIKQENVESGGHATPPADPEKYGFDFLGWSDGTDIVTDFSTYEISGNITFTAQWDALEMSTVTFNSKGGTNVDAINVVKGETIPSGMIPANPTRDGFDFHGWSETDGGAAVDISAVAITDDKIFYAVWANDMFSLTNITSTARSMNNEDPDYSLENEATIVGGAAFGGCTNTGNKQVLGANKISLGGDDSYIKLELNNDLRVGDILTIIGTHNYRITYVRNRNASFYCTTTNRTYSIPAESDLLGRQVIYLWRIDNSAAGEMTEIHIARQENAPANEFVYITFDSDEGSAVPQQKLLKGEWPTVQPETPTRGTDLFQGWFLGTDEFTFGQPLSSDITLTAHWLTANYKTVRFYSQGVQVGTDIQVLENQLVPTIEIPDVNRDGYNFKGWSTDGTEANIKDLTEYLIQTDVSFVAVWHKIVNVTTDVAGVQTVYPYEENDKADLPSPQRDGYIFAGWKEEGATHLFDFATSLTNHITLIAQWTDANPDEYIYAYNDAFHYDGTNFKDPEGKPYNLIQDNQLMTTPYTIYESDGGITSIVVNNGRFDGKNKTGNKAYITPYIKLATSSSIVFTIKEKYEATLVLTASGYDAVRTVSWSDGTTTEEYSTEGRADQDTQGDLVFYMSAGTYTLTVKAYTLFISNFTLTTTLAPQDVKLADLQIDGVTVDGFSPLVDEYDALIPYAAANLPVVTYTASDPANVTVTECWYPMGGDAYDYVATVTSNIDPTASRTYTIHFTPGTKDKLVIVRGDYVTNNTCTVTGKYKNETNTKMIAAGGAVANGYKFTNNYEHYIRLSVAGSGETFHEGDLLRVFITSKDGFNNGSTLTVYGNAAASQVVYATGLVGEVGLNTIALPAEAEGRTDLYLMRVTGNTWNPFIRYAEVVRTLDEPVITSFSLAGTAGVIDQTNKTINVELPAFTSYVQTPVITTENNSPTFVTVVTPDGEQDFSSPVVYTLTDKDGDQNTYTVNVTTLIEIGNADNSAVLAAYNGKKVNVNFTRPIDASNGDWYTLCLPFNMSAEQIAAAFGPCQLATLATSEWLSEYNLARIRHTHVSAIEAGVPYLFLPENSISGDVTIPGVTIDNTERPVTTTYVDFIGTFNPKALTDDGYTFYLDDNNMLYHPWENMTLRATRCYYHFHNLTPAQMQNIMARVMIDGDANHTPTTVEQITADPTINGKYILNGQLIIIRDGIEYTAQGQIIK